jgi:hypothetical protein
VEACVLFSLTTFVGEGMTCEDEREEREEGIFFADDSDSSDEAGNASNVPESKVAGVDASGTSNKQPMSYQCKDDVRQTNKPLSFSLSKLESSLVALTQIGLDELNEFAREILADDDDNSPSCEIDGRGLV